MLDQLKAIYQTLRPYENNLLHYQWFQDADKNIFGIHESELKDKDMQLLNLFFEPYHRELPTRNTLEDIWYKRIHQSDENFESHPFRFIYFSFVSKGMEASDFKTALEALFEKPLPILWESENEGIMIEEVSPRDEQINFEPIIDILMADLSVNIYFYIGQMQEAQPQLNKNFLHTIQLGRQVNGLTNDHITYFSEVAPFILLNDTSKAALLDLSQSTLKHFYDDVEMIKTLEVFFEANLNISESAKKLYMHRNSIQYRIDKFTKETGINIQNFNEAMTVKLAILAKNII